MAIFNTNRIDYYHSLQNIDVIGLNDAENDYCGITNGFCLEVHEVRPGFETNIVNNEKKKFF